MSAPQAYWDLTDLVWRIGDLVECNGHFSDRLARMIEETGKKAADLTLGELAELCEKAREKERELYEALNNNF